MAFAVKVTVNTLSDIYAISNSLNSSRTAWMRVGASGFSRTTMT
jgi:hypothetical protein